MNSRQYVQLDDLAGYVTEGDITSIVLLIETSIKLITDKPLESVIEELSLTRDVNGSSKGGTQVNILLDIDPSIRSIVFGKRFSNIACLRKLISNGSGKSGVFYVLTVQE